MEKKLNDKYNPQDFEEKLYQEWEEKGYFKFGGSTIILLVNNVNIDEEIINNSNENIETIVKMGEVIGTKVYKNKVK